MVRLLHLTPSLQTVAPGPAWAALLSEADANLIQQFTDEWYRSCCTAEHNRLSTTKRYTYAGADQLAELRVWLAAVRSRTELLSDQRRGGATPAPVQRTPASSLPGLEQLQCITHDSGVASGVSMGLWSLYQWQAGPAEQAGVDEVGADVKTLVVVFGSGSTAGLYLQQAVPAMSEPQPAQGTEALPGCPCLHAHKSTLRSLLGESAAGGGSSALLRLRVALQPFRRQGYRLRLVGHGAGGATALLALLQLMAPPRTEFEVDDEPGWTEQQQLDTEAQVRGASTAAAAAPAEAADFRSIRAVGFGSPAVLALPPQAAAESAAGGDVGTVTDALKAQAARVSFSTPFLADAYDSGTRKLPAPERPTVCNRQPGLLRVRWQHRGQVEQDVMQDTFEFELEYRAVVAGVPSAIAEKFSVKLPWPWQAVKPMVTSLESEESPDGAVFWHTQSVSSRAHGLVLGKTYIFRVRQRSLEQHSTQNNRLVKSKSYATAEEAEAEAALWSEWSQASVPVRVLADDDEEYLKAKVAAAEQQLQQLFERHTQSALELPAGQFSHEAHTENEPALLEATSETKRLQRLERLQPDLEPQPDRDSVAAAQPVRPRSMPAGRRSSGSFAYMDELRACATTHFELVVNRGDVLPRVLGQGNAYCSRGSTDSNEAGGGGSKCSRATADDTADLQMLLRHIVDSTASDADTDDTDADTAADAHGSSQTRPLEQARGVLDVASSTCADSAYVGEAFSRYAHHGSVHIIHTDHGESGATAIGTVANPSVGMDDSHRWLHLRGGAGGRVVEADGVGTGYVFVAQMLDDHSLHRYSSTIARLCAMAHAKTTDTASNYEGARRVAAQRPKPKPPLHEPKVNSDKSKGKAKAREAQISEEQRL